MRRLLSSCLVLLLVLRGLVGSAMAAGMVPMLPPASPDVASLAAQAIPQAHESHGGAHASHDAHPMGRAAASGHHPCADAASDATPCPALAAHGEHAGGSCSACEICHSAMLTPPVLSLALPSSEHAGPLRLPARFSSAPMAPAIKPPIA